MASLVAENPFDIQQPKAADAATSAATAAQPTTGLIGMNLPATGQAMTYTPEMRQINAATDTVQGQVNSILSKDTPLMQRARTLATQQMAQRGLVNSSINAGAGTAAMIDRALPIAQQDASTYNTVASDNVAAKNRASEFGAGQLNQFTLQKSDQDFQSTQADLTRKFQTSERVAGQDFQTARDKIQNDFTAQMQKLQEEGLDRRQAQQIASSEAMVKFQELGINNRFDREMALKSTQFDAQIASQERQQANEIAANLETTGMKITADRENVTSTLAVEILTKGNEMVTTILSDPKISAKPDGYTDASGNYVSLKNATPDKIPSGAALSSPKTRAIDNQVTLINSQITTAAKVLNTELPEFVVSPRAGTSTATAPAASPAPVAPASSAAAPKAAPAPAAAPKAAPKAAPAPKVAASTASRGLLGGGVYGPRRY